MESLLIITGTMGAGKSAVLAEATDILTTHNVIHAAIDLDALALGHLGSATNDEVMHRNLRSVSMNYSELGVRRFMVARAVEDEARLKLCREIVPAVNTQICRITASLETMKRRVEARDTGIWQQKYIARVVELNRILDLVNLEDFTVANENRSVTDVAFEMLVRAGWIRL